MADRIHLSQMLLSECRAVPAGWTVLAFLQGRSDWRQFHVLSLTVDGARAIYIQCGPASATVKPSENEQQQCIDRVFHGQRPFVSTEPPQAIPLRSGCDGWLWLDETIATSAVGPCRSQD